MITLVARIWFFVFVIVAMPCAAQNADELFNGQRTLYTSTLENADYNLSLSALRKINGEWQSEREETIPGNIHRRTIEITRPLTLEKAWQDAQSFFGAMDSQLIFECQGLACGSSNAWANERFGVKQLYGLDLSQRYQVWQVSQSQAKQIISLYLVQRGNRRVYGQIETLTPTSEAPTFIPSSSVIANDFYSNGQIEIRGLTISQGNLSVDEDYLNAFAQAFNQQPFRSLVIVGHDYLPGADEEQTERSLGYAQSIYEKLVKLGVQAKRMKVKGVGSLAPDNKSVTGKVVVLLERR